MGFLKTSLRVVDFYPILTYNIYMLIKEDEGIVLRSTKLREIDKIVTIFSREHGVVRGVAKGALKFKNRFGSSLEPLSHIKFIYYEREGKELFVIKTADLIKSYFEIQKVPEIFNGFSQMIELVEKFFPQRVKEDKIFRLLKACLEATSSGIGMEFSLLYFKFWLLKISGFLPDLKRCKKCGKEGGGFLSPSMDGIYCDNCAKVKTTEVSELTGKFLEFISKNPPLSLRDFLLKETKRCQIENVANELVLHHAERTFKTLNFRK